MNNNQVLPDRVDELIDKLTVTVPHLTDSGIVREYCREAADALAAYNALAPHLRELVQAQQAELARVTAERDAAVKDLCLAGDCDTCYMRGQHGYSRCSPAVRDENGTCVGYKWRGPQKEGGEHER